jgi:Uncharacterized protein conserved in bacteria (DUF2325)
MVARDPIGSLKPAGVARGAALPLGALRMGPSVGTAAGLLPVHLPGEQERRARIWDLGGSLHCSIVGTCLTTAELRVLAQKFGPAHARSSTDHEIHGMAVLAIGERGLLAKQIQKALDRRHAAWVRRLGKVRTPQDLGQAWDEAMRAGDIPGAYWAMLTHPAATAELVRRVFGDVHMLSHLVGAANRADIRRLQQLEEEKAALEDKLSRQQARLRDDISARDAQIRQLGDLLSARMSDGASGFADRRESESEASVLEGLVARLRKQLERETRCRERIEVRAQALAEARTEADRRALSLEAEIAALRGELEAAEHALTAPLDRRGNAHNIPDLQGMVLLYVGGRPQAIARLRSLVAGASGELLHHDGGIEDRADVLAGLVSRADAALFPADCVSHNAALALKRLCRQAGKRLIPLRSSGIASALRALRTANPSRSRSDALADSV